ncbi:MAG: hypothetical protein IPG66_01625 [Hydrogenophilales bacterium]|nr:hypothetical protein [Hydrogenophilales bacterium]
MALYSSVFVKWFISPGADYLFEIMCIPVALVLDASIHQLFGNTPGKAMLGLKVELRGESILSYSQYLGRNFSMWAKGMACGVPVISFFSMINQSVRIADGKQASYDESGGYNLRAKPIGWVQVIGFGMAYLSLIVGIMLLKRIGLYH